MQALFASKMPVLLLLDEHDECPETTRAHLRARFSTIVTTSLEQAVQSQYQVAIVVSSAAAALSKCAELLGCGCAQRVVLAGTTPSLEEATRAIHMGIADIVEELCDAVTLTERIEAIIRRAELRAKTLSLCQSAPLASLFPHILGESEPLQQVRVMLGKVVESDSTILITGEPGTGKSLVARSLHAGSGRAMGPFVEVNCRDIGRELAKIGPFGYGQEAFTGTQSRPSDLLAQASGGTLFLDEVAELPAEVQFLLSRVLRERLVRTTGNCAELSRQARLVGSSSRDLEAEVRLDFFLRLNVVRIHLCPLRERGADILLLAQYFLKQASTKTKPIVGMTPATARILMSYDWPGNVSELRRCMARAVGVTQHDHITAADVLLGHCRNRTKSTMQDQPLLMPLVERERLFILDTLRIVKGNKTLAARKLGLDRKTLARKLRNYQTTGTAGDDESAKTSSD